jgi:drug/metabolite transporter (DMT)-like permease
MRPDSHSIVRATAMIVLSSCSFGSLSTLTLLVMREGVPLVAAMFWRYLLAAIILAAMTRRDLFAITRGRALRLMLIGAIGQAIITYLSLRTLDYLPVGVLAFLFYTYPGWVAILAAVARTEELTFFRIMALLLALTGIAVMVGMPATAKLNSFGVALALGTALLYALYLPALHRAQSGIPPLTSAFYLILGVFAAFLVGGILTGEMMMPSRISTWALVIGLAVLGTVLAFTSMIAGLRVLGPLRTSIVSTIEPFFTAMLGVAVLGEELSAMTLAGGALIAAAVCLLQLNSTRVPDSAV